MPAGIGLHPWFRRPVEVRLPAERAYASNTESRRIRCRSPAISSCECCRHRPTGSTALDRAHRPTGRAPWPEVGVRAAMAVTTDAPGTLVAVATPHGLDAIAVEPQTHGPDPFRRLAAGEPDPPALLTPGASMQLTVGVSVERIGDAS